MLHASCLTDTPLSRGCVQGSRRAEVRTLPPSLTRSVESRRGHREKYLAARIAHVPGSCRSVLRYSTDTCRRVPYHGRGLQRAPVGCQLLWASLIVGGLPIPGDTLAAPPTKLTQALVAPFWRASSLFLFASFRPYSTLYGQFVPVRPPPPFPFFPSAATE